ncbi:glycoside hydrolase family 32 protein [Paenibacillus sp. BAC0078]
MEILEKAKHRPVLHFSPAQNWINDPNGLIYFEGEYHLFYQYHPFSALWGPMHWGHAVSKDLIKWEELGIALYPDHNGTAFSGSAVVDWNNTSGFFPEKPGIVAIYTSHLDGTSTTPVIQSQSLAYSHDKGRTWIKYEGNPVLGHPSKPDFRDPKVFWSERFSKWIMVLATDQTITIYSSGNLREWELESEFGDGVGSHEAVWECPDLFELPVEGTEERRWVLLVSIGDNDQLNHGSRTQYFIGSFDGSVFTPEHNDIRWLDYGRDNYAGVSFSDIPNEDGRRIYLGWMSNWRYARETPTPGWRGAMTIPRSLMLREEEGKIRIRQQPVGELVRYLNEKVTLPDPLLKQGNSYDVKVDASVIELNISLERCEAKEFGLIINHTDAEKTVIAYSSDEDALSLHRDQSGETGFSDLFINLQISEKIGTLRNLRVLLDSCSVEVFANDGMTAITSLVFPAEFCQSLSFYAADGDVQLRDSYILLSK